MARSAPASPGALGPLAARLDPGLSSVPQGRIVAVTATPSAGRCLPAAAALAVALATAGAAGRPWCRESDAGGALLLDLSREAPPRSGLLASDPARGLAASLAEEAGMRAASRGHVCFCAPESDEGDEMATLGMLAPQLDLLGADLVVSLSAERFVAARGLCGARLGGCLVQASPADSTALLALLVDELRSESQPVKIWRTAPGMIQARRALAGLRPGGETERRAARAAAGFARVETRPRALGQAVVVGERAV